MNSKVRFAILVPLFASGIGLADTTRAVAQATAQTVPAQGTLSVARFWRGDGVTAFEGVVGVGLGGGLTASPQVALTISDSDGRVLFNEAWTDSVSQQLLQLVSQRQDVAISTPVRVNVKPGTYTLTANIRRGAQVDSVQSRVTAFAEAPVVSDLIVSNAIRALTPDAQVAGAEVRVGQFGIVRNVRPSVAPDSAALWYYLELYRRPGIAADSTASLEFTVLRATGGAPLLRLPRTIRMGERGGSDVAKLPLQGLPPGEYVLRVNANMGGRTEQREAAFAMASFDAEPLQPIAPPAASSAGEEQIYGRYFAPSVKSDSAISQIVDALTVVSLSEPMPAYVVTADSETKRRVLARYFARLADPMPETAEHELLEEYTRRAEYAAREFAERDLKRSGLRTDRGRVYLKYGAPDAKQIVPLGASSRGAVELWRYSRQRGIKYAFLDRTGFQHFTMIYTTDPSAQSMPDWATQVGDSEIAQMIVSF